jgi:hypothetical protein
MTTCGEGTPDELEIHHRVTGIGVRIPGPPPFLKHLGRPQFFEHVLRLCSAWPFLAMSAFFRPRARQRLRGGRDSDCSTRARAFALRAHNPKVVGSNPTPHQRRHGVSDHFASPVLVYSTDFTRDSTLRAHWESREQAPVITDIGDITDAAAVAALRVP